MAKNFLKELQKRNVVRVAVAYMDVAWLIIQLINELEQILELPGWLPTTNSGASAHDQHEKQTGVPAVALHYGSLC